MDYTIINGRTRATGSMFKSDLVPVNVQRRKAKSARLAPDRKGSQAVRARSGGVCEACGEAMAVHVHHKLGGHGVRGSGESAKAEQKLHLCAWCHAAAHGVKV
jgi:hypothetical protein